MIKERLQTQVACFRQKITEANNTTLKKSVMGLTPDEVLCGSETKHDKRIVPRQKLFVSARTLQE
jgi:hypothetical protein